MLKSWVYIVMLFFIGNFFSLWGCTDDYDKESLMNIYERETRLFLKSYQSRDIKIAKDGLSRYINSIIELKKQGFTLIDYKNLVSQLYVKMYLIEKQQGNLEAANNYLDKCLRFCLKGDNTITEEQKKVFLEELIFSTKENDRKYARWME